jgi:hypothetical protein
MLPVNTHLWNGVTSMHIRQFRVGLLQTTAMVAELNFENTGDMMLEQIL